MIWRVVTRYAELAGRPPAMTPAAAYGVLDGLFQQALLGARGPEATASGARCATLVEPRSAAECADARLSGPAQSGGAVR